MFTASGITFSVTTTEINLQVCFLEVFLSIFTYITSTSWCKEQIDENI